MPAAPEDTYVHVHLGPVVFFPGAEVCGIDLHYLGVRITGSKQEQSIRGGDSDPSGTRFERCLHDL